MKPVAMMLVAAALAARHPMPDGPPEAFQAAGFGSAGQKLAPTAKPVAPKIADATPEEALRTFLTAMIEQDEATIRVVALQSSGMERLWLGEPMSPAQVESACASIARMPIRALKAGDPVALPRNRSTVLAPEEVGPKRAVLAFEGAPVPTRVHNVEGRWKVDPAPMIAARKAADVARGANQPKAAGKPNPEVKVEAKGKRKATEGDDAPPTPITTRRIPRKAPAYEPGDLEDLARSFAKDHKDGFRDLGPAGSILVGVRVSYVERAGARKIRSAQPIFRRGRVLYEGTLHGDPVGETTTIVAKDGYGVGKLATRTGASLDGFRMTFMKLHGGGLDSSDSYDSPWLGDEQGGRPSEVASPGPLVVGLQGRSDNEVFALGLTTVNSKAK